jgi:GTP-binding protein YchF
MLRVGIVGLPNVGKSTLFNALTRSRKAEAANYPFCTIDPNIGVVNVPDARLEALASLSKSAKIVPAAIEFCDIAGLVKGASQGEGLGNKFLSHIREADAVVQVVRCFESADIHHVSGSVDPVRDIEVISTELILADIASLEKQQVRIEKSARGGDKEAKLELALVNLLHPHLNAGKQAITLELPDELRPLLKRLHLLSAKPTLFACNVAETELAQADQLASVKSVKQYVSTQHGARIVTISAQIESDLVDLSPSEAVEYLSQLGVSESGVNSLIREAYALLGLQTFFTTGEKETRAWTIPVGARAPEAAGVIHSDFQRGFITAETIACDVLLALGSRAKARDEGKLRIEGKDYIVQDGDVMEFRFNV